MTKNKKFTRKKNKNLQFFQIASKCFKSLRIASGWISMDPNGSEWPLATKKSQKIKKTIEKDATPKGRKEHGTKIERLTARGLRDKPLGYLKDQMEARGKKFIPSEVKGKKKPTKEQLSKMILEWDAKNPPKPADPWGYFGCHFGTLWSSGHTMQLMTS